MKEEFQHDLYSSINLAMKNKNISFIPGCVELGDFDATSTAAAIAPCDELQNLPQKELMNTFEKYYEYFIKRLDTTFTWENYTPYEIRIAGTFLYLNNKERAHKVLNFFFNDQRPKKWNQWAEVIWRDIKNPKFIGDMPHTWVGSDYINSVRAMFAYEREYDNSLIIGAGIKEDWLKSLQGVSIKDLPTYFGKLNYSMLQKDNTVEVKIDSGLKIEKLIIISPLTQKIKSVTVNGKEISSFTFNEVVTDHLPSSVVIFY